MTLNEINSLNQKVTTHSAERNPQIVNKVHKKENSSESDNFIHLKPNTDEYLNYTSNGVLEGETVPKTVSQSEGVLPERYDSWGKGAYQYYKGELISQYDLIMEAVKMGAITLDESQTIGWNFRNAKDALIYSQAKPLYEWSSTLYSEDKMYVFRVEGGIITGATLNRFEDGTTLQDIANEIASGIKMCDLDHYKTEWLMWNDRELYDAACSIGNAKRWYDEITCMYKSGDLTKNQYMHDCYPLLILLLGEKANVSDESSLKILEEYFNKDKDDFLSYAFSNYSEQNQKSVDQLIKNGYRTYSGIY